MLLGTGKRWELLFRGLGSKGVCVDFWVVIMIRRLIHIDVMLKLFASYSICHADNMYTFLDTEAFSIIRPWAIHKSNPRIQSMQKKQRNTDA